MKYTSKEGLIEDIEEAYRALTTLLEEIPTGRFGEAGVWGDGWTVNDLVVHLSVWHRMFLGWYRTGLEGEEPELPAPGYRWNETPALNREIWRQNRGRPTDALRKELEASHSAVLELARSLSEGELLRPGSFAWTGSNPLVTYLGANTASHYRFARKVLRRWRRSTT